MAAPTLEIPVTDSDPVVVPPETKTPSFVVANF